MVASAVQSARHTIDNLHALRAERELWKGFLETHPKIIHKGLFYRIKDVPAI